MKIKVHVRDVKRNRHKIKIIFRLMENEPRGREIQGRGVQKLRKGKDGKKIALSRRAAENAEYFHFRYHYS